MLGGHGGNIYEMARRLGCAQSEIIDMSSNINPLGPPPGLVNYLEKNIDTITNLPEVDSKEITKIFANRFDLNPECILAGNGTTQFIFLTPRVLETKGALILGPTYADYADACRMHNVRLASVMAEEADNFRPNISRLIKNIDSEDTVFICNPNNPTGSLIPKDELEWLCRFHPDTNFIVDESYLLVADGILFFMLNPTAGYRSASMMIFKRGQFPYFFLTCERHQLYLFKRIFLN